MSEPTPEPQQSQAPEEGAPKPPWERSGEAFDPDRAWKLIQNLQGERDTFKTKAGELEGRVSEFEQQSMTEQQRIQQRAEQAETAAREAQQQLLRYRIAADKGVPADLLAGDTEEAMAAHADQLLAFRGQQATPVPSFDGGSRQPAPADDMNTRIRRSFGRG